MASASHNPSSSDLFHSIVVPVYNSRSTLTRLKEEVDRVMAAAGRGYELVLVDDGSRDGSFEEIKRLAQEEPRIKGFRLSRNFGHQAALTVGLERSRGGYVAIIDDALQDPPEVMVEFFNRLDQGLDVVYGLRRGRKESWPKRFLFSAFYRVLNRLSEFRIPLDSGDFCAMRRPVVEAMLRLKEAHPFLRGVRSWAGFRQEGLEYDRSARAEGESGYTFTKYFKLALNAIMATSRLPLRVATGMGFFAILVAVVVGAYQVVAKLVGAYDVPGYASLVVVMVFLGGVQLFCLGVIGEYLGRIFDEVRGWPVAFVAEQTEEQES